MKLPIRYEKTEEEDARQRKRECGVSFLVMNAVLTLPYIGFFIYDIYNVLLGHDAGLIFSPARSAVSYENRVIDLSMYTDFQKRPGLDVDSAWHQLLKCSLLFAETDMNNNIAVQNEDLKILNRTSVLLRGGPGYLAGIDVLHELHCLNIIRENVFSDYYKQETHDERKQHILHCIDHLRQILMCHGDNTPQTFECLEAKRFTIMKRQSTHVCKKWEPIVNWAHQNEPSRKHGPILEHPQLGKQRH
ncbi:hypothetical protein LZ31DRAFT_477229 [Colletotrichum somersetense]|nr:hypothetical protein LZ31DRAFT_477229 [Colletotrichum somersetense]